MYHIATIVSQNCAPLMSLAEMGRQFLEILEQTLSILGQKKCSSHCVNWFSLSYVLLSF